MSTKPISAERLRELRGYVFSKYAPLDHHSPMTIDAGDFRELVVSIEQARADNELARTEIAQLRKIEQALVIARAEVDASSLAEGVFFGPREDVLDVIDSALGLRPLVEPPSSTPGLSTSGDERWTPDEERALLSKLREEANSGIISIRIENYARTLLTHRAAHRERDQARAEIHRLKAALLVEREANEARRQQILEQG